MAKVKFDFTDKQNILRIEGWARDGLDDKQIAANIGYNETYFSELKGRITELSEALKKGRAPLDVIVESTLYRRAIGMKIKTQQAFKVKEVTYTEEGKRFETERVEIVELDQELPPDPTSMIFWLKNRKPEQWNKQTEKVDITTNGKDFKTDPIIIEVIDSRDKVDAKDSDNTDIQ
ncbi:transposase [Dysgonomonas sp. 521]|uniref:transposase n=1 Tax=Dysgonomonas sp. 521 TaxID=2302932 RepID=UPI0013D6EB61|nr:transposase [Dysgonomonas sp. 521]NDV93474.1 transposase [Dysgonomonas sp. 521]